MLLVANQIQLYTSVNDLSKSHGFKFTNVQDSFYPIGIHISICHKRGKIIMPLNNLSFLPGKVTCLSQNKDPLETYDRKLSDVVFCLQEYKRGGGVGVQKNNFSCNSQLFNITVPVPVPAKALTYALEYHRLLSVGFLSQRCPARFQYNSGKAISKHFCIAASRIELAIS